MAQQPPQYYQPPQLQSKPKHSGLWTFGLILTISGLMGTFISIVLMLVGIGWCMIPFALMALVAGIVMLVIG